MSSSTLIPRRRHKAKPAAKQRPAREGEPEQPLRMSEAEFVDWCDDDTWAEWVNQTVELMSPINNQHAAILTFLVSILNTFVSDRNLGEVRTEPFQVRLTNPSQRRSPDLLFVTRGRADIIQAQHVDGAPDLILEIVSPQSQSRDRRDKYLAYEAAGVREYWIVDPLSRTVEAYRLDKNKYVPIAKKAGRIASAILPGFFIQPDWLWKSPLPKVSATLRRITAKR